MLTYSLEHIAEKSIYEYLYRCIKDDIVLGKLRANEKLPSKRSFAKNLGISNTTVENAYAQLLTEGYLYSLPKKGYFVSPLDKQVMGKPLSRVRLQEKRSEKKEYFADFMSGSVATDVFPFSVWIKLLRNVMATEEKATLLTDRPAGGLASLRSAIANHLRDFRGMDVLPEQIIVGAGTEYLYTVLVQLLGRERIYGVEDPGYMRLTWILERNDIFCRHIPMDHAGVVPDALKESGTEILHITPSHHFPTGIVMPASRRYELLGWASEQEGRYIIEDDYDCEFRLSGKPIPTLQSIDRMEKVIYINTFSQSLAPAFRMSYLVLPLHLVKRFHETLGFYSGTVSCFEQLTLARFLEDGYFEKHINRMRTYYRNLRDQLLEEIRNSSLAPIVRISEENSGVHFLMEVKTEQSDEVLIEAAERAGILLSCVSQYYYDESQKKHHVLVLNYSGIPPEKVTEAVARLARCIASPVGMGENAVKPLES